MNSVSSDEAYRQAGVDLDRAAHVVTLARKAAQKTLSKDAGFSPLGGIGGFSGAFEIPEGYRRPVILCACDGVGTKLKLACMMGLHHTVGIDLVAMNVNDLLVCGGQPLVFLDYIATGAIDPPVLEQILNGIAEGCRQAGCALIGGETAEMPGFYQPGDYDLAGFSVGVVEKDNALPKPDGVQPGHKLIGLMSTGLHSNGYSLVRKILLDDQQYSLDTVFPELEAPLGHVLLAPTQIYVKPVLSLLAQYPGSIQAMAHITGGGFYDNIPRILPDGMQALIHKNTWQPPPVFPFLQQAGKLDDATMFHTFNCGIGFILVVSPEKATDILLTLKTTCRDFAAAEIGEIRERESEAPAVIIQ